MFARLKSLFAGPKRIEDSVFGSLLYMGGYWEGRGRFDPLGKDIEWFIYAGEGGPEEPHYSFLQSVCTQFPELQAKAHRTIGAALSDAPPLNMHDLTLVAIDIPSSPHDPWELSFETPASWHFAVQFVGWEPSGSVDVSH